MVGHVALSQIVEIGLGLIKGQWEELLVFKSEGDSLNKAYQGNCILHVTDVVPLSLLLELALEQIGTLSDDQRTGYLDVVVWHVFALDTRLQLAFENHLGNFFCRSWDLGVHDSRRSWDGWSNLAFVDDGGSHVSTMLALSPDMFGNPLWGIHECVSLLAFAAIENAA